MNEDEIVIYGKWEGAGYGEHFAIVRSVNQNDIDVRYASSGAAVTVDGVKSAAVASSGEDYWRAAEPEDFTDQRAVSGQVVWVSHAREEENSDIYQGIVLSSTEAFGNPNVPLRTAFGRRTRTLLPQSQAGACDSFWAVSEPEPVYCDDD